MTEVVLSGVRKRFGGVEVIRGVDLTVPSGEFCVLVGPSGCGKSTLLRMIAGLEEIDAGELIIGDRRMNALAPSRRGVAMVFQSYALYPHMTVYRNMAFGLTLARESAGTIDQRVRHAAEMLELTPLLDRLPRDLSGGQRQRVAIGRAIVRKPKVFLFDEPLSNLDAALRMQTRVELANLHRSLRTTTIYVTHDQAEAMTLADRIAVLNDGRIEQVGPPLELYHRPGNLFVAGFIGSPGMNFLAAQAAGERQGRLVCRLEGGEEVETAALANGEPDEPLTLGIRPEHMEAGAERQNLVAEVNLVEQLGDSHLMHVSSPAGRLVVRAPGDTRVTAGERLGLGLPSGQCHVFRSDGTALPRANGAS